jgi:nucleoside-diphosphate-sugar epimerase
MKRVLVLGAAGFVGRRIVRALAESEWAQPIAGVRRIGVQSATGVPTVIVDVTDRDAMMCALKDVDCVVNCVAGGAEAIATGAQFVFECAARVGTIERVVHMSTMSVYGSAVGRVEETAPLRSDAGWYSEAKVQAEEYAQAYARKGGAVVTLRPGCIYGPESGLWTGRIGRWLRAGRIGDLGSKGDGLCNLVFIDDVVAAVITALQQAGIEGHAFNLVNPTLGTWNQYFLLFGQAIGSAPVRRISRYRLTMEMIFLSPLLKIAQLAVRRAGLHQVKIPEPIPPSLFRLWQQKIQLDSTKAGHVLQIAWTPEEKGLEMAALWFNTLYPSSVPIDTI